MRKSYSFNVDGHGAEGQTFHTQGTTLCEFQHVFNIAMEETFHQLTNGKAVFGCPGVGCRGPYSIKRVVIEEQSQ